MVTGMTVSPGKMNSWSLTILYKQMGTPEHEVKGSPLGANGSSIWFNA